MLNSSKRLEKFLQNYRFKMAKPFLKGDVLDFGGNYGELKKFVSGNYQVVNYDYSRLKNNKFDTIVCLAVIEHMEQKQVYEIFAKFKNLLKENGQIFLTTPAKAAKPVLSLLAFLGLIDKINILEHKHYWAENEIFSLAEKSGFKMIKYKKFQLGFNQLAILKHD